MLNLLKILVILAFSTQLLQSQDNYERDDSLTTGEIEVTANRLRMSNELAPNKIQVIDTRTLNSLNGSRLADVLSFSDNIFIKDYGFNSGLKTISLNSTQSEQTLILVDGVKLNGSDNAQYDVGILQLDDALRIEVSKGGSSALYGSEAIGGVVNIITSSGITKKPFSLELKAGYGSYDARRIFISTLGHLGKKEKGSFDYDISYSNEVAKNNYDYYYFDGVTKSLRQRENAEYFSHTVGLNLKAGMDTRSSLQLRTSYNYWNRNLPGIDQGYSPGTAKQIDRDGIASLIYTRDISRTLQLKSDLNYKYSLRSYFDTASFNLATSINSFYKSNSVAQNSALSYTPSKREELNFGYEVNYSGITSNEIDEGSFYKLALFVASKYELPNTSAGKITFYPSVRYDRYSNLTDKDVFTGKFGLNLKPLKELDLTFKASAGNNFRAPDFNDLYWKDLGNKNLKPERSLSFDAGIYLGLKKLADSEIEISYFNINTSDRIVWSPGIDNIWRPANIGKVLAEGVDVSFKSRSNISKRFGCGLFFNYNYASAIKKNSDFPGDPSLGKQMLYIPKELVKSSIMLNYLTSCKIIKFVSLNAFYTFTGARYMNPENTVSVPHYQLFDMNMQAGFVLLRSDITMKLAVNNILNEDYSVVAGYPMPLRNFKIELSFKY